jgi:hypothetical protein
MKADASEQRVLCYAVMCLGWLSSAYAAGSCAIMINCMLSIRNRVDNLLPYVQPNDIVRKRNIVCVTAFALHV